MKTKKVLAVILSVIMLLSSAPLGGLVGLDLPDVFKTEASAASISLNRPLDRDYTITAREYYSSGSYHGAIDYGCPKGTPIYAAESGTITIHDGGYGDGYYGCKDGSGWGNYADISHGSGYSTRYAHMSTGRYVVNSGDSVSRGQLIGYSGNSGNSTGPHLHFGLYLNGSKVYPEPYIKTATGYFNSNYTTKPTTPTVSVNGVYIRAGSNVIIDYFSEGAASYWIGIYKNKNLLVDIETTKTEYVFSSYDIGEYNVVVTAINPIGETSGYATFYLGNSGDYLPSKPEIVKNFDSVTLGEEIILFYSATNTEKYWIGIYFEGELIEEACSQVKSYGFVPLKKGEYSAVVTAINGCSENYSVVQFSVGELEKPIITKSENVVNVGADITFYYSAGYARKYWIGIYNEGKLIEEAVSTVNSYNFIPAEAGIYSIVITAINGENEKYSVEQFTVGKYIIEYYDNFTENASITNTKNYNSDEVIRHNTYLRKGYTFKTWNTKADGTGTDYAPGATYSKNADLTLYAQWIPVHTHSYTSKITKEATCTSAGTKKFTCSCGDSYTETIKALGHSYSDSYTVDFKPTCTEAGVKSRHCIRCTAAADAQTILPLGHTDKDNNGVCDVCKAKTVNTNPAENCNCNCHKDGFMGFIWKFINFFNKLFKIKQYCECGAKHW